MTKPREKTRDELTAEIEDSEKKIRQYENRDFLYHFCYDVAITKLT